MVHAVHPPVESRRLFVVVAFAALAAGAYACAGRDLNPQPLPPGDDDDTTTVDKSGSSGTGSVYTPPNSSSSGGSPATDPETAFGDAGPDADAGADSGEAQ